VIATIDLFPLSLCTIFRATANGGDLTPPRQISQVYPTSNWESEPVSVRRGSGRTIPVKGTSPRESCERLGCSHAHRELWDSRSRV